ncbi:MAG: class 3 adenylate cyclase/tetratricopeptide (TPR) repeat protein [Pseudohongiellaceae bacterium]
MAKKSKNTAKLFWDELKRRKTTQTAIGYLILIVAVVGPASDILAGLGAPDWIIRILIIGLLIGLPVVLVLSWVFDVTWHGLERTKSVDSEDDSDTSSSLGLTQDSIGSQSGDLPSVIIEAGTAHKHQVTMLSVTFVLTKHNSLINDPEALTSHMAEVNDISSALAEKYSALEVSRTGTSLEFLFGYPQTYENDAIRATAMGLAIVEDVSHLAEEQTSLSKVKLAALVGIGSDSVIIDIDKKSPIGIAVVGQVSETTRRIQTLAEVNQVLIDSVTFQLLRNRVTCERLKLVEDLEKSKTSAIYRAIGLRQYEINAETYSDRERVFLGRDAEIALIMDRWERAEDGEDEFVVLRGEPGIGKTTIIQEVTKKAKQNDNCMVMPFFCSPLEQSTPFKPIIEYMLGPGLGLRGVSSGEARTQRIKEVLEESEIDVGKAVSLVASLISFDIDERSAFSESARSELIKYLLEMIRATSKQKVLLIIFEDLHWADPSTLDLIKMLVSSETESGLLCIFTTRPHVLLEWEKRSNVTTLSLENLSKRSTFELVNNILRELNLPEKFIKRIVNEAGGNPLFTEELAKAIFETAQSDSSGNVSNLVLPGTLQRSLASRIDNLGKAKPLLQLCSLLGREFSYKQLAKISDTNNEMELRVELHLLVNAEFLYQQGSIPKSTYIFKHALMQETAYQSMLNSTRKELHARVANLLEQDSENLEGNPELLAFHFERSEQVEKAITYWTTASNNSMSKFAMTEAGKLAGNALRQVEKLPDSKQRQLTEIKLQAMRGKALLSGKGYAEKEVELSFSRALELCDEVGDVPQLFQLLVGLWSYFQIGGSIENAKSVAVRLMRLAESGSSPAQKVQANYSLAYTTYRSGEFQTALTLMEKAKSVSEIEQDDFSQFSPSGDDERIHVLSVMSHIQWQLGNTDIALSMSEQAIALAESLKNPIGIVFAYFQRAWLAHLDKDYRKTMEWGNKTIELAMEKQLAFWISNSKFMMSWATFAKSRIENSNILENEVDAMLAFVTKAKRVGAQFGTVGMFIDTAEALSYSDRLDEASLLLAEAEELIEKTGEGYLRSEQLRVKGLVEYLSGDADKAVAFYLASMAIAIKFKATSYQLRSAMQLADLYHATGDQDKAASLMNEIQQLPHKEAVNV